MGPLGGWLSLKGETQPESQTIGPGGHAVSPERSSCHAKAKVAVRENGGRVNENRIGR